VWSWWKSGSVHHAAWPSASELPTGGDAALLADVSAALIGIRGVKSNAKVSMKTELTSALVAGPDATIERLQGAEADLRAVGRITTPITWQGAEAVMVTAQLVPSE
jgi:valyl-tRNA synthetase